MLDLVLWLSGFQGLGEVTPESVKPCVRHLEDAADVGGARLVEKDALRLVIAVLRVAPFTLAIEQPEGNEGIGEVGDRASVETERLGDLRTRHRLAAELGEQLELDRRQQGL